LVIALLLLSCGGSNNADNHLGNKDTNSVVAYFKDAELQAETDDQRQQIKLVLSDIISLNADELRVKRYPDYQNAPGQWDVIRFLKAYFVPATPMELTPAAFFDDFKKPEAVTVIQEQLNKMARYIEQDADSLLRKK
jgi:hypothetical protein